MSLHYTQAAAGDNAVRERDISLGDRSKLLMSIEGEKKSEPFAALALLMGKVKCRIRDTL